jgi:hypothetical protein
MVAPRYSQMCGGCGGIKPIDSECGTCTKLRRASDWPKVDGSVLKPGAITQLQPGEEPPVAICCGDFESRKSMCVPRAEHWKHLATKKVPDLYDVPGYEALASVLIRAHAQAASGKGAERHAQGQPFDQQPMQQLIKLYGPGFALGQAAKKAQESQRLPKDRAVAELLGAINYLAGAVIALENQPEPKEF